MSRPHTPIDWEVVDDMLEAGCLGTEIAEVFVMHPNTFYDRVSQKFGISFTEYSQAKRAKGDGNLRLAQYLKALGLKKKGDNTLLIWLGKQRLNQKDNAYEEKFSEDILKPFTDIMNQIGTLQADRNIADSNIINEEKSQCVMGDNMACDGS